MTTQAPTQQALPTGAWSADTCCAAELRKALGATGARVTDVQLAVGHAHERLDPAGHPADPTQEEALRDSVRVLLGERETAAVAA